MYEIPIAVIEETLDAMYFNFSPYLENGEIEQDWILELIEAYNKLVAHIGQTSKHKIVMLW